MKIAWTRCESYEAARDFWGIIYLHEWDGKPFYWGKADKSFFGGHMRERGGLRASGRYNAGYRHWIEGCLRHGARLYVGKLDKEALRSVDEIEAYLVHTYGSEMNSRTVPPSRHLLIQHEGAIPVSISRRPNTPT
jgi:hypothetical protein